jgi:8-oxo-dGTP pyrophosphatase MutT (NUDIX family)
LRREIKEEVNLEVKKLSYLLDMVFIRPDGIPVITLSFWAHYKSGKVKLDEDSIDYKWVTLKEAKEYDLIDGIWEEIEMVDKILKEGNNDRIKYRKK